MGFQSSKEIFMLGEFLHFRVIFYLVTGGTARNLSPLLLFVSEGRR